MSARSSVDQFGSSRVRIWTVEEGTTPEERSRLFVTSALEARNPLQTISVNKNEGSLPASQSGIEVSRTGVTVTAFGTDPDGNTGTLLRVWEQVGVSGKLMVTLPKGMDASVAVPVNLRGEKKGDPIHIKSGKFELELSAYAPASFILE